MTQVIATASSFLTTSNGSLTATVNGGSGFHLAYCNEFFAAGKFYWEMAETVRFQTNTSSGIAHTGANLESYLGSDTNGVGLNADGFVFYNGPAVSSGFPTRSAGDRFATELDLGGPTLKWRNVTLAGAWSGTFTIPAGLLSGAGVTPGWASSNNGGADSQTFFFAAGSWLGTPEAGYGPFDPGCHTLPLHVGCGIAIGKSLYDAIKENPTLSRRRLFLGN